MADDSPECETSADDFVNAIIAEEDREFHVRKAREMRWARLKWLGIFLVALLFIASRNGPQDVANNLHAWASLLMGQP